MGRLLDSVGVSLEAFCEDGIGGWLLGYMEALRLAGIRTVLILMSARIEKPLRVQHRATGATISVLPAPRSYRAIRCQFANSNPYFARTVDEMTGHATGGRRRVLELLNLLSPYIATPPGRIAREVRRQGCAAILCQDYETPRFDVSILVGRLLNIPMLACFQSGCYDSNRIGRSLRPLTMKACSGLVVAPQAEIERVRDRYGVPSDRIAQIFNPVDAHFWRADDRAEARAALGVGPDDEVVIWHGRVDMQAKRLDVLLDAWQSICSEHPGNRRRLLLLGTGEDAQELERRIAALTVTNVRWLNMYTTDRHFIRRFLSAGDVYAFPSVFEVSLLRRSKPWRAGCHSWQPRRPVYQRSSRVASPREASWFRVGTSPHLLRRCGEPLNSLSGDASSVPRPAPHRERVFDRGRERAVPRALRQRPATRQSLTANSAGSDELSDPSRIAGQQREHAAGYTCRHADRLAAWRICSTSGSP